MKPLRLPSPMIAFFRALARDRRGHSAVEFALVCLPFLLFLFGIIAVGQAVWLQNALDASVAEAARCASVNPTLCGTSPQIQTYAASQAGAGFNGTDFSVTTPSCGKQVSANYPFKPTLPFVTVTFTLTADACYPV
jgi:Flp pilus assembly protein TadG